MEYLPIIFEGAKWYGFFCLVTALTICVINIRLLWLVNPPWGFPGYFSYLFTTFIMAFVAAPGFFIVMIRFSELYNETVITTLLAIEDEDDQ